MSSIKEFGSPTYIVGDQHLDASSRDVERIFLRLLDKVIADRGSLIINGDLFDFWFEWRSVVPRHAFRTLAGLANVVDSGLPVLWIGGNHDCWGGDFLTREVGVDYMLGVWEGSISGWRTRIEHGDGLRPREDRRYRALRSVLRNPIAIGGMRLLHPDLGHWLARRSSSASRDHRARDGGEGLRRIAHDLLSSSNSAEVYVLGHSHVAALESLATGGVYANAGSWMGENTYLVIQTDRIELRRIDASAEEQCLHAVDRRAKKAASQLQ